MHLEIDRYSDLGYAYVKNFLTPEESSYASELLIKAKSENRLQDETKEAPQYYYKSWGGSPPGLRKLLDEKTEKIKELFKMGNIVPEAAYGRIYYNESTLNPHFDRNGLDHTLSVILYSNLDEPWPLYCLDKMCNLVPFDIKVGDGAMIPGKTMVHWRKPLSCRPDQYVVAAFFHWKNTVPTKNIVEPFPNLQ
jgi:hypothetical protein